MLLAELAERSGTSAASIKYYRREGLLPPGARVTTTRQEYDQRHLDRLALIRTLREAVSAPIPDIRTLTAVLDDPEIPLVRALEIAQGLVAGVPARALDEETGIEEHPAVHELLRIMDWPDVSSVPRRGLSALLDTLGTDEPQVGTNELVVYARALERIAAWELTTIHRPAGAPSARKTPSRDVVVQRAVQGMSATEQLVSVLRALAHASLTVRAAQEPHERA